MVEAALLVPWLIFMFIATFDFGFYCYALISVEDAARAAVLRTSTSPSMAQNGSAACDVVLESLRSLPNINTGATCSCTGNTCTIGSVATVTATYLSGVGAMPFGADGTPAARVSIQYQTLPMLSLPFLRGTYGFTRAVEMKL